MTGDFSGKSVIVTGGGRGVGRGVGMAFAAAGARVMLGARTIAYGKTVKAEIEADGGIAEACAADIAQHEDCRALVEATVAAFGGVDIIVHAAADIPYGGVGAVDDARLEAGFASIAKAAWWLLDAARPHLGRAKDGGRFIAIGSINGTFNIVPNMTAYGMAKAALDAFIRAAAGDVVGEGITVNAINPGLIASDRAKAVLGEAGLVAYGSTVPVGRAGTPADIAHACLFLASAKSDYITGTTIKMDGGSTLASARDRGDLLQERLKLQEREAL